MLTGSYYSKKTCICKEKGGLEGVGSKTFTLGIVEKCCLRLPEGPGATMFTFRGFLACLQIDADRSILRGASYAKMGARIKKIVPGFAGGDVDVHFMARTGGRVGFGV